MNGKRIAMLKGKNCGWCEDAQSLLNELDVSYALVDVEKNKLGEAIAKKKCEEQSCLIVEGKSIKKPDRNKIADELLD